MIVFNNDHADNLFRMPRKYWPYQVHKYHVQKEFDEPHEMDAWKKE